MRTYVVVQVTGLSQPEKKIISLSRFIATCKHVRYLGNFLNSVGNNNLFTLFDEMRHEKAKKDELESI